MRGCNSARTLEAGKILKAVTGGGFSPASCFSLRCLEQGMFSAVPLIQTQPFGIISIVAPRGKTGRDNSARWCP
jgi:hypothetical protein